MKILRKLRSFLPILLLATMSTGVFAQSADMKRAIEQLHDMDPAVRTNALYIIASQMNESEHAIAPVLEVLSNDPDPEVKRISVQLLGELARNSPNPQPILAKLRTLLDSEERALALAAIGVLESFPDDPGYKSEAEKRFAILEQCLKGSETDLAEQAVAALGASKDPRAEKTLIALLQNPEYRATAARTLANSGSRTANKALLDFTTDGLKSDNPEIQELALTIFVTLPDAEMELESELAQLAAQETKMGVQAASFYYKIKPELALPLIEKALASSDIEVRRVAIYAAASVDRSQFGSFTDELAALIQKSTDDDELQLLLQLIAIQEPINSRFLDSVVSLASSKTALVRTAAIDALTRFGVESKGAIPTLTKLLNDKEPEIQFKSVVALYQMTGDFGLIEKPFEALMKDPEVVAMALNYIQTVDGSLLHRRVVEALKTHALAGKTGTIENLVYQTGELDPQVLKLFNAKFDSLDSSQRSAIVSRLSYLHPAREGVVPFLKRCLDSGGDERWSAAPVYLRFTGDTAPVTPIIKSALTSDDSAQISVVLATLGAELGLAKQFSDDLSAIALKKSQDQNRNYAFLILSAIDSSRSVETALILVRQGDFAVITSVDDPVYRDLTKRLTPADREKLVTDFLALAKDSKVWADRENELLGYLKMFAATQGWPNHLQAGLKDIESKHTSEYIREYAVKAREKQVQS